MKYEEIYVKEYRSGVESNSSLICFFHYYDFDRPQHGPDNQTPWEIYRPSVRSDPRALSNVRAHVVRMMGSTVQFFLDNDRTLILT